MRWSLLAVKLCIVAVYLVLIGILLLATVPLITGGMDIELPEEDAVNWSYEEGVFTSDVSFRVYNGGILDIEECQFTADSSFANGSAITTSRSIPVDLKAKQWTDVRIPLVIDVNDVVSTFASNVVFNGTTVNVQVDFSTYVALRLIHLSVGTADNQSFDIPALISNVQVYPDHASIQPYGDGYAVALPYAFDASVIVVGQSVGLQGELRNITETLSTTSTSVTIQKENNGQLLFPLSDEVAQHLLTSEDTLYFDAALNFGGSEFSQTYTQHWFPPSSEVFAPVDLTSVHYSTSPTPIGVETIEPMALAKGWCI